MSDITDFCDTESRNPEQEELEVIETELPAPEPERPEPWNRTKPVRNVMYDINPKITSQSLTDKGNANRFRTECEDWIIFDQDSQQWYFWDETCWKNSEVEVRQAAAFVAVTLAEEQKFWEKALAVDKTIKTLLLDFKTHHRYSCGKVGIDRMLSMASVLPGMYANFNEDSSEDLLACRNGILNTKTGEWIPKGEECDRLKRDYPIHYIDRTYMPASEPERFLKHLNTIYTDNVTENMTDEERLKRRDETVRYMKRLLGYLLVAGNPKQIFVFLWGSGRNGKSATIDALAEVIGDTEYAQGTVQELYSLSKPIPLPSLAQAVSKRILYFPEITDCGDSSCCRVPGTGAVSRDGIKGMVGDEYATWRGLHKDSERKKKMFTPIAATNELPHFDKPIDKALSERLVTIPHNHYFKSEERIDNFHKILADEEGDEIFSLMVNECIAYTKEGLLPLPESCKVSQKELLAGSAQTSFINEMYEPSDKTGEEYRLYRNIIQLEYIQWCRNNDIEVKTRWKEHYIMDKYNNQQYCDRIEVLIESEAARLFSALVVHGFQESSAKGRRFFRGRRKGGQNLWGAG